MMKETKKTDLKRYTQMEENSDINLLKLKHLGINLLKHSIVDTCNNLFSPFSASDKNDIILRTTQCFKILLGVRFKVRHSNSFDNIVKTKNKSISSQLSYAIP